MVRTIIRSDCQVAASSLSDYVLGERHLVHIFATECNVQVIKVVQILFVSALALIQLVHEVVGATHSLLFEDCHDALKFRSRHCKVGSTCVDDSKFGVQSYGMIANGSLA